MVVRPSPGFSEVCGVCTPPCVLARGGGGGRYQTLVVDATLPLHALVMHGHVRQLVRKLVKPSRVSGAKYI